MSEGLHWVGCGLVGCVDCKVLKEFYSVLLLKKQDVVQSPKRGLLNKELIING